MDASPIPTTYENFDQPGEQIRISKSTRILDVFVAALSLLVLSPLIALILISTKLLSRGPVIFKQQRIGFRGKPFMCFKFRTMKMETTPLLHQAHTTQLMQSNAPLTKLDETSKASLITGAWILRASGLDELPQLINVLRGEMSIVGPRPCIQFEYDQHAPWQKRRFHTLPGITGLWQVSGKNMTTFEQMVRMDIHYAQRKSVGNNLKIMLMTIPIILIQLVEIGFGRRTRRKKTPSIS